ncbi:hypothetical protein HY486_04395 [Candidatus Woesearchaeota archaeon]|nr:hypothetical protein [Candidatus Woesearchaeota archaeon]
MAEYTGRCMRCKTDRQIKDAKETIMKGKVKMRAVRGICVKCGATMYKILGKA